MNPEPNEKIVWHHGIFFVAASLLFVALTAIVKFSVSVPAIDADRGALIAKALADMRAAEATALDKPGWIDRERAIVRLPIETALEISVAAKSPAAARADLIARAEKAAAPAPKAAKPSFE